MLIQLFKNLGRLFEKLYSESTKGEPDCTGFLSYEYISGEDITHICDGSLNFLRMQNSIFKLRSCKLIYIFG